MFCIVIHLYKELVDISQSHQIVYGKLGMRSSFTSIMDEHQNKKLEYKLNLLSVVMKCIVKIEEQLSSMCLKKISYDSYKMVNTFPTDNT